MNAQHHFSALWKRLLAALSLAVAATLAASAVELASRAGSESAAKIDHALFSELDGIIEGEQYPDAAAGDAPPKAQARIVDLPFAIPPAYSARPQDAPGGHRTHAARSGLTRAPPLT